MLVSAGNMWARQRPNGSYTSCSSDPRTIKRDGLQRILQSIGRNAGICPIIEEHIVDTHAQHKCMSLMKRQCLIPHHVTTLNPNVIRVIKHACDAVVLLLNVCGQAMSTMPDNMRDSQSMPIPCGAYKRPMAYT